MVDDYGRADGAAPGNSHVVNLDTLQVYFGASVEGDSTSLAAVPRKISHGLVGCLADLKLDHQPLPLHQHGANLVASLSRLTNIQLGCKNLVPLEACDYQPCQNSGVCHPTNGPPFYSCVCHNRYRGATCEVDTAPCASSPCLHSGLCVPQGGGRYNCSCHPGTSGRRCEIRYCNINPCHNGGVCEEGLYQAICNCPPGFTGALCDIDVNECAHNPCQNEGVCINLPGGFRCTCHYNYTGPYCTKPKQSYPLITSSR